MNLNGAYFATPLGIMKILQIACAIGSIYCYASIPPECDPTGLFCFYNWWYLKLNLSAVCIFFIFDILLSVAYLVSLMDIENKQLVRIEWIYTLVACIAIVMTAIIALVKWATLEGNRNWASQRVTGGPIVGLVGGVMFALGAMLLFKKR